MKIWRVSVFSLLALLSSGIGWLCLAYAASGVDLYDSAQLLGLFLFMLAPGYLLLAWVLVLYGLERLPNKFPSGQLLPILSVAGFFAALPLAITFSLADNPIVIAAIAFVLAWLPLSMYLSDSSKDNQDHKSQRPKTGDNASQGA